MKKLAGGLLVFLSTVLWSVEEYPTPPEAIPDPSVPSGKLERFVFDESKWYPGTTREWGVYIPDQYVPGEPACVMIVFDGIGRMRPDGRWKIPTMMDHLIHKGEMPVTIGIFINPGRIPAPHENAQFRYNRSFEYDSIIDRKSRFVFEEIVPLVSEKYTLSGNPDHWSVMGASSGATAAMALAWHRPDRVRRVISYIGTFVNYKAGASLMTMFRKGEPRPLRIFLQEGRNDKFNYSGSWWIANQDMEFALNWAGYEVAHEWGDGGHDWRHGASITPDILRWIWKDFPRPVSTPYAPAQEITKSLPEGSTWTLVHEDEEDVYAIAGGENGEIWFSSGEGGSVKKLNNGTLHEVGDVGEWITAIAVAQDGELILSLPDSKKVIEWNPSPGSSTTVMDNVFASDVIAVESGTWISAPGKNSIFHVDPAGEIYSFTTEKPPANMARFIDHARLSVFSAGHQYGSLIEARDGPLLKYEQPFHQLQIWEDGIPPGALDCVYDESGRLWVATLQGIQILNNQGRTEGLLMDPKFDHTPTKIAFGGKGRKFLYAVVDNQIYRRPVKNAGLWDYDAPRIPEEGIFGS